MKTKGRVTMDEIIYFFKNIFMPNKAGISYVGLTWLNSEAVKEETPKPKARKGRKDVKLSDLMRRTN